MARSKRPPEAITGGYSAIPHAVIDSAAFVGATDHAKSLLFALMRQTNGRNNGHLQLTDKWLAKQGWSSSDMNKKYQQELIERGLIVQTKRGGLNCGANLFALTWLPISNFVGLDITARSFHPGAWAGCKLPPTPRRKPPKRGMRADHRSDTAPTTGVVDEVATPMVGVKKALLRNLATPTTGNNVTSHYPPVIVRDTKKRIVGKAGRSGMLLVKG